MQLNWITWCSLKVTEALFYIYFITKWHLRTIHVHQNCVSLFVLFIGVIKRTVRDKSTTLHNSMFPVYQTYNLNCLLTYLLHGAVIFEILKGFQSVKEFPSYYRTRRFITAIKVPASVSILSQLDPVHTPTSHFLMILFNIILPSTTTSPKWSHSFKFPHQCPVYSSPLPTVYCHNWYLFH